MLKQTREWLRALGVTPRKSRGQHFLVDAEALAKISEFIALPEKSAVLEIGPGLGVLTEKLKNQAGILRVVEIEKRFAAHLVRQIGLREEEVLVEDIRNVRLSELRDVYPGSWTIVGNIPYSISGDVIFWVFENRAMISRAVLLFQKEFAERVAASPGSRAYGVISVKRTLFFEAKLGPTIPGDAFFPPAKVSSALLELTPVPRPEMLLRNPLRDTAMFDQVLDAAFSQRRKTLANCLTGSSLGRSKAEFEQLLRGLEIDPQRRAETLSLDEYLRLTAALTPA